MMLNAKVLNVYAHFEDTVRRDLTPERWVLTREREHIASERRHIEHEREHTAREREHIRSVR